jgi:catechol 2,3-dioxygenase-like lactoylglutathione lyase family enzyme
MPKLTRVLETALYVADLNRSATFYGDLLACPAFTRITGCRPMTWAAMACF